jgi:hypothetical protein
MTSRSINIFPPSDPSTPDKPDNTAAGNCSHKRNGARARRLGRQVDLICANRDPIEEWDYERFARSNGIRLLANEFAGQPLSPPDSSL